MPFAKAVSAKSHDFDEDGNENDVKAYHVNEYIQERSGEKFTAKDFRTWGGTKIAAKTLCTFKKKDKKIARWQIALKKAGVL